MSTPPTHVNGPAAAPKVELNHEQALARIREALRNLRYGEVTIVLQDGFVVQIERSEKQRLGR